jgi:iron only hydrogenase large subunit-like protein
VGAISKDESGRTYISFDRCISCGKCVGACPFGAIAVKSQLVDVLRHIKERREVIAMFAPAFAGQFSQPVEKLHGAIKMLGFSAVYEVALGAETTALAEAKDFMEHLKEGKQFLTTSCCAAYNEFVAKHLPEMKPFVSLAGTPLRYTAELARGEHPGAILVFFSPCFAKYREVYESSTVDYALNFEEVTALFEARKIDVASCSEEAFPRPAAREAREFSLSGGVSRSVLATWTGDAEEVKPVPVNGLDKESIGFLRRCAETGQCGEGNLIEVMACPGGCIGGGTAGCPLRVAEKQVRAHAGTGRTLTPNG